MDDEEDIFESLTAERVRTTRHPTYDVTAHGATGDGTTDDTAAIQTALDAAAEGGGGVVYLPAGTYYTTYSLLYGSDLVVYGPAATVAFEPSHEDATALVSKSFDGSVETSRVTIQGLTVESVDPAKGNGIGMAKAADMAVKACQTHGLHWHLVDIAGATDVLVADCYAANLDTAAYQADNLTSDGGLVVEYEDGTTEGAVVDDTNNRNVDIAGNVAEDCGRGVHLHRDGGHDLTVRDNRIRGCTEVGILGDPEMTWHDVVVAGNVVEGDGDSSGIRLDGEYTNLSVANNTVRDHDEWGIAVHPGEDEPDSIPRGVTVRDNTVERVAGTAIALDGAAGEVSDNYVYDVARGGGTDGADERDGTGSPDSTHAGVTVEGCDGVSVRGNVLRDLGGTGVVCRAGSTDVVISGNDIADAPWGIGCFADAGPLEGVAIDRNTVVGGPEARGGVWAEAGVRYRIDDNAATGVALGVAVADATDLHLTGNDVVGDRDEPGAIGYRVRDCTDTVVRDNDATRVDESTVVDGASGNVRAEVPDAGLVVGGDCEGVRATFEGDRPPEDGAFAVGSRVRNTAPAAGGHLGWVCVAAGSPGSWKPYGRIGEE
ncbi:right-handed parallel beta-helix repeat-containing protein [Halococcus hamelinensis]|uniref:Pectate lyase superfamily protein domain-containing protein n=1 Tax=Halococcus hamelinensis 100A6 TaxID=1132509 RepID=M0MAY7_9EURY|nr:right-handed parallel beta-helix repeat-containing protein [Halococcus hamelinensis]EMA41540.1 hypothetical protein C447_01760 [Halococcus hamelinensis 100A6]